MRALSSSVGLDAFKRVSGRNEPLLFCSLAFNHVRTQQKDTCFEAESSSHQTLGLWYFILDLIPEL
jgi:hypothetical protein